MLFFFQVLGIMWICFTLGMLIIGCDMITAIFGPILFVIDFYETWQADKKQREMRKKRKQ